MKKKNKAYEMIKAAIFDFKILPNQALEEKSLTEWLNISRTPLREALSALEKEGFVRIIPHKGTFVSEITIDEVNEVLDVREVLSSASVRLATPLIPAEEIDRMYKMVEQCLNTEAYDALEFIRIDNEFHQLFDDYCGNSILTKFIKSIGENIKRMRIRSTLISERTVESTMEHLAILRAVKDRDATLAELLMRQHIQNAKANTMKTILLPPGINLKTNITGSGMVQQPPQSSPIQPPTSRDFAK